MEEILNDYAELMLNSENVEIPDKICDLMRDCYDFASSSSELRYLNSLNFKQAAKLFNDLLSDKIALFENALEKNWGIWGGFWQVWEMCKSLCLHERMICKFCFFF